MCKYGLGVSHFKGIPWLILLICKFDKWSKTFSVIIVSSFLTLQVYIFGWVFLLLACYIIDHNNFTFYQTQIRVLKLVQWWTKPGFILLEGWGKSPPTKKFALSPTWKNLPHRHTKSQSSHLIKIFNL